MTNGPEANTSLTIRQRALSATTVVLVLICLMYGITYVDRVAVSTAAFIFKRELNLNNMQVGLVFSAFAYPYLVFQIIGGWLGDRFGARLALSVSAVIWAIATLATGMVGSLGGMLFARVMLGFGEGATFPTATKAMSDWVPESNRAFAQGITHSSARLGNSLTPPLVAWLIALVTWRGSFVLLGFISLAWAVVWGLYFRDVPGEHAAITSKELEQLPSHAGKKWTTKEPVPWFDLARRMLPVTGVCFCYGWTLWLYLAWVPLYFLHSYGLDLRRSALFAAGIFLAGVLGDALGGTISDRILRRTGNRRKARRNLVVFGFLCSLTSMFPLLVSHNIVVAAICLSVAFFFSEFTICPMWAIPMDIAP
jgi:MFS family permease